MPWLPVCSSQSVAYPSSGPAGPPSPTGEGFRISQSRRVYAFSSYRSLLSGCLLSTATVYPVQMKEHSRKRVKQSAVGVYNRFGHKNRGAEGHPRLRSKQTAVSGRLEPDPGNAGVGSLTQHVITLLRLQCTLRALSCFYVTFFEEWIPCPKPIPRPALLWSAP